MHTEVIKAELKHCAELAASLDEPARGLIEKYYEAEPEEGLRNSFKLSVLCWTILINGKVAGMFGCTEEGVAWLTTSPDINDKTAIRFVRQSKPYIEQMRKHCGGLMGYVHKDNQQLIKWLEWSGFEIIGRMGDFEICVLQRD